LRPALAFREPAAGRGFDWPVASMGFHCRPQGAVTPIRNP
jgi:hypothetical protein